MGAWAANQKKGIRNYPYSTVSRRNHICVSVPFDGAFGSLEYDDESFDLQDPR